MGYLRLSERYRKRVQGAEDSRVRVTHIEVYRLPSALNAEELQRVKSLAKGIQTLETLNALLQLKLEKKTKVLTSVVYSV